MARTIVVDRVDEGRTLERFLERLDGGLPVGLVRRLFRQRRIRVNDVRTRDAALRLKTGDRIEIHYEFAEPTDRGDDPRRWPLDDPPILHEDEDFLVLGKAAGIACSDDGTDPRALAVWLRMRYAAQIEAGTARPEPCHRLDRGTTGVVAVALNPAAFDRFRRSLEQGLVHKRYEVVVHGIPARERFRCDEPLRRDPGAARQAPRMIPGSGLDARTEFSLIRSSDAHSLLAATPITGRTHQIRAHCLALGLPVVGDPRYGGGHTGTEADHQLLHAQQLRLDGERGFAVELDWPEPETSILRSLGLEP